MNIDECNERGIMKRLIVTLSVVMTLILLVTSCSSPTPQTSAPTTVAGTVVQPTSTSSIVPTKTAVPTSSAATIPASDSPKYGGILTIIKDKDTLTFDDCYQWASNSWSFHFTNEELMLGDWTRGPAGTGEVSWLIWAGFDYIDKYATGGLAEKWEIDWTNLTITFNIRKGVYFHNKAPTNGREMTSADVAFSINRQWSTPGSWLLLNHAKPVSVTTPDKYTVVIKFPSFGDLASTYLQVGDMTMIWPADAVQKFGDMRDWRNSLGTGPFMLTDYVKGSAMTFVRNPNHWDKDPIGSGKGNKLPYVDGAKLLIIPDVSTQLAAMRTGKADRGLFMWDMAESLKKSNPELLQASYIRGPLGLIHMRQDNPEFPWSKKEVRQALHMAVDYKAVSDGYYGGTAEWYCTPTSGEKEYKDWHIPFEQLPQNVRNIWTYQPEKAKKMLADAGYANGFTMEIVCTVQHIDLLSIYKDYWSKIGVTLVLDPKDTSVFNSIRASRGHKHAYFGSTSIALTFNMSIWRDWHKSSQNMSMFDDLAPDKAYYDLWANYSDYNKVCQIYKDITPYMLEQAWFIPTPGYREYTVWQPWLKGYHGEYGTGNSNEPSFMRWIWIDQDLKEKMTGNR